MAIKWYGTRVRRIVDRRAAVMVRDGAQEFADQLLKNISAVQGPPRSLPDEYPHMDTGDLADSVFFAKSKRNSYIAGTRVDYSMDIEDIRPHVVRTLFENMNSIAAAMKVKSFRVIDYSGYSFD